MVLVEEWLKLESQMMSEEKPSLVRTAITFQAPFLLRIIVLHKTDICVALYMVSLV